MAECSTVSLQEWELHKSWRTHNLLRTKGLGLCAKFVFIYNESFSRRRRIRQLLSFQTNPKLHLWRRRRGEGGLWRSGIGVQWVNIGERMDCILELSIYCVKFWNSMEKSWHHFDPKTGGLQAHLHRCLPALEFSLWLFPSWSLSQSYDKVTTFCQTSPKNAILQALQISLLKKRKKC